MIQELKANTRLFFEGALLSYIALFHWLRPAQYIATKVVGPVGQILFFTFLGDYGSSGQSPSFYIIGNAVQLAALSGIFGVTFSIIGDRWNGTLPYLFGAPANRLLMFVGRAFIHIIDGSLGVLIGLFWGVTLLGLDLSSTEPIPLVLVILLTTFSTSGLGLALGSLSLVTRNVMFINNTAYFILLALAGSNISIDRLPALLQKVSAALPLTRGIMATRAIIDGASLSQIGSLLIEEFLLGTVYVLLGYTLFRLFERQAKRMGTLEVV
ncbi:MAG: ABC transporter permease [Anaerolineales bacterium]|jgi:ABC-2 type transport system permease protein